MKSTVSCGGHRWLENDKTAFGGTEGPAGTLRSEWETEQQRHIHGAGGPEIQQGRDGIRMESSEELFASVAALVNMHISDPEPRARQ